MTQQKEYIYICEKCGNNISSSAEVIICKICGNKIDGKYSSWSSNSSRKETTKPGLFSRILDKVYSFFGNLSGKWKTTLFFSSLVIFLFFPLELADLFPFLFWGLASVIIFGLFMNLEPWKYFFIFKWTAINVIVYFTIFFSLYYSHSYRSERLLNEKGIKTTARLIDIKTRYGKHTHITVAVYTYQVNRKTYKGKEIVNKEKIRKLYNGDQLISVEYAEGRPRISRISNP